MRRVTLLVLFVMSCDRVPVSPPDAAPPDVLPSLRPTKLDVLVVLTVGATSDVLLGRLIGVVELLKSALLEDPSPPRDIHFGFVTSKVDSAEPCSTDPTPHDGTLLTPPSTTKTPRPYLPYPLEWPWPPPFPYLTSDMFEKADLINLYMNEIHSATSPCSVTQFLEAAARAIDGRNGDFLRSDSLLLVLILADREDCSTKDSKLWSETAWSKTYTDPNAVCYEPPDGLLHPASSYVPKLQAAHPAGRTLVASVAMSGTPTYKFINGKKYAEAYCTATFQPSIRLPAFTRAAEVTGSPSLEPRIIEGCPGVMGPAMDSLAKRVLQSMTR
jgi:hypothetical protein